MHKIWSEKDISARAEKKLSEPKAVNELVVKGIKGDKGDRGRDGKDGRDGEDGLNGERGADGKDGREGIDGKDGKDGRDGKDGKDGKSIKGDKGEKGEPGKPGLSGKDGRDGASNFAIGASLPIGGTRGQFLVRGDAGRSGLAEWNTLAAGDNITLTKNETTHTLTIASSSSGSGIVDGDYGDITVSSSATVMTIDNDVVTYAKMQNVSATDKLLGRSTSGAGDVEEITCTAAGRALIDDADASAQRTTLGLGTLATQSGTFSGTSSGTNTGDQNLFGTIVVSGQSDVVADSTSDTLTLAAGSNITITTNASTDTITIAASGGGGSSAFADLTSGTNSSAAMVVGTGASLAASGSGTIAATSVAVGGITGLGTGVATALAINVGSAGAPVTNGGALGTPSSGVATNLTGTAASLTAGTATVANTVSTVNEATDTTCFLLFVTASGTQSLQPKNNTALTFNSNTGVLGATTFSGAGTSLTGTAASLTAGNVTTNANLTGIITSSGNATSFGTFTSAQILAGCSDETGTGALVFATSPTFVTPLLGTPTSGVLTNCTGTAASLTAGTSNALVLTPAPSSDVTTSGTTMSLTAGENVVFGDIVYVKSDGKMWKADANAAGLFPANYMAIATILADAAGLFLGSGFARNDAWNWTVGGKIYLSTTAGGMTQTAPSATDDCIQVLGTATHADRMNFTPSPDYATHA